MTIARRSVKREAILSLLRSVTCHPSAEWLHGALLDRFPGLSLGTVYRNLRQLEAEGLIVSVGVVRGQERFDGNLAPHGHFICRRCGAVLDVPEAPGPALERRAERLTGARIDSVETRLYGLCADCRDIRA